MNTYTHYIPNSSILLLPYVGHDEAQEGWRGTSGTVERQGWKADIEAAECPRMTPANPVCASAWTELYQRQKVGDHEARDGDESGHGEAGKGSGRVSKERCESDNSNDMTQALFGKTEVDEEEVVSRCRLLGINGDSCW